MDKLISYIFRALVLKQSISFRGKYQAEMRIPLEGKELKCQMAGIDYWYSWLV